MTTIRDRTPSPIGAGGQAGSPLRAYTHTRLSHPSSRGIGVTLRVRLDRSRARAESVQRESLIYLSGGPKTYKRALNAVLGAVQAGLAAEAKQRPEQARGLYSGVITHLIELIADLPALEQLQDEEAS